MPYSRLFEKTLEAFSTGDAMGMPTEFMTSKRIKENFGFIEKILDPSSSIIHKGLKKYQVTDDTEQVVYLLEAYYESGEITVENTVSALLRWMKETNPQSKGYIGPASQKALEKLEKGENPEISGKTGTTCGAAMRILAPSICVKKGDFESLDKAIRACALPTHNTSTAMEASASLGYAFHTAASGASFDEIIEAVFTGSKAGEKMSSLEFVGASSGKRFAAFHKTFNKLKTPQEAIIHIYDVIGTTMESNEVVPSALCIFAFAKADVWTAIRMGASIGGDTDTIAAIAGALSALYARGHNIPEEITDKVISENSLDMSKLGRYASSMFNKQ